MEPQTTYTVTFDKKGHYPKIIKFITNSIPSNKELKLRDWDFYLYQKIEGINDPIFYKPIVEYYDEETGFMTYDYGLNDSVEFLQNKMYHIYRDFEKNGQETTLLAHKADDPNLMSHNNDEGNDIKRTIKQELSHPETLEREDSILNQLKIKIHTEKAQLELDKLKAQTEDDKNLIQEREHEILLAETEILLVEQEIENARKQMALQNAENKNQKYLLMGGSIAMIALLILIGILYKNDKSKKRVNKILHVKNQEVLNKNREIVDSIKYAKRLQQAILPSEEVISEVLEDAFILYLPKDIVSGDFYWVAKKDDNSFFATVDCTGHGVPGAFMSIIGFNGLNQAINEYNITSPAKILDFLNKSVSDTLHQQEVNATVRDGMDISLCSFNQTSKMLSFSGAYNHLYIIRNNEFIVYKADKQPVGTFVDQKLTPFTQHDIQLQSGDAIYVFTDGYVDQFGGEQGKKLKLKHFKKILLDNQSLTVKEQKDELTKQFTNWKKREEQVDDVLVLGFKVT